MSAPDSLNQRMAEAARELEKQFDAQHTMQSAVDLAVVNVTGCEAAGISIVRRGRDIYTPASTDPMVAAGDRLQYETGEGPCLDAIWDEETVYSPSLAYDRRWPLWGPRVAAETGAQSVLAFQLFTDHQSLGALNLYSRKRDAFDDADREDGQALAAHIAIAVAAVQEIGSLTAALDSRSIIGQATGILMERYGLDQPRAFAVLARVSAAEERKVRDIAVELVETRALPSVATKE
jgi:transcriptional regulator with GAF, ATPase, and Fis domain